jgi:SAM-dependent methyltransferase
MRRSARVLDIGCGDAVDLAALRGLRYRNLVGIDDDDEQLDAATKRLEGAVQLEHGRVPPALRRFERGAFDVILDTLTSQNVLRGRRELTHELARLVVPGGLWIAQIRSPVTRRDFAEERLATSLLPPEADAFFAWSPGVATHLVEYADQHHRRVRSCPMVAMVGRRRSRAVRLAK